MSKEAIRTFLEAANRNDDLRQKVSALREQDTVKLAGELAAISTEAGSPIAAAVWQAFLEQKSTGTLDDSELETIAGGFFFPPTQDWTGKE